MNRSILLVSLTVAAAATVLVYYGGGSHPRSPDVAKDPVEEAGHVPYAQASDTGSFALRTDSAPSSERVSLQGDREEVPRAAITNEADTREWVAEETAQGIREDYLLLIEQLGLSSSEKEALLIFLTEDAVTRTKTSYSDGIGMDEHERSARIQEILGETKLREFLSLESNLKEFRELQYVQNMLQDKGVPLTEKQSEGLFEILVGVRGQVDMARPQNVEPGSLEALEYTLTQLDEYDRLVAELVPSVLSPSQAQHMFERNLEYSYRRSATLEWHRQRQFDNLDDGVALGYFPKKD